LKKIEFCASEILNEIAKATLDERDQLTDTITHKHDTSDSIGSTHSDSTTPDPSPSTHLGSISILEGIDSGKAFNKRESSQNANPLAIRRANRTHHSSLSSLHLPFTLPASKEGARPATSFKYGRGESSKITKKVSRLYEQVMNESDEWWNDSTVTKLSTCYFLLQ
jgi:hypothetical protein